jgi:hypothetical protein
VSLFPEHALSVMEGRGRFAPKATQLDLLTSEEKKALWRRVQLFPTPPAAVRAMLETLDGFVDFDRAWFEPCAGLGHIVTPLRERGFTVYPSDLVDHGKGFPIADALDFKSHHTREFSIWCTNPPFTDDDYNTDKPTLAERLIRKAQGSCDDVIVFGRLGFLVTGKRYALMHENPIGNLTHFLPLYDRLNVCLGHYNPKGSGATDYAWFHFQRGFRGTFQTLPIPPGTIARLTKPEDVKI